MRSLFVIILAVSLMLAGCVRVVTDSEKPMPVTQPRTDKPVINSFTASPTNIKAGSPVVISWSISGATDININPEIGPADRQISITVYPTMTTDYTLTASNQSGSVSQIVKVEVVESTPVSSSAEQTTVLNLVALESGSLVKSLASYTLASAVCAGDNVANQASRAFLSFDITSIPPAAQITEATLDLSNFSIVGSPTYTSSNWGNMGALDVYQYQYGPSMGNGRLIYDAAAPKAGSLKLSDPASNELKLDVTNTGNSENTIQRLTALGQSRCQFRVQFFTSTNWDSKADMLCMDGALLKVKYTMP